MQPPTPYLRHLSPVACAVLVVVLLAACGDDNATRSTGANPGNTPPPTTRFIEPTATVADIPTRETTATSTATTASPGPSTSAPYDLIARWGEPAPLVSPVDVAIMRDGTIVAADAPIGGIAVVAPDGALQARWSVAMPRAGVEVDDEGFIYTTGTDFSTLARYDRDGTLLLQFDLMPGDSPQQFQLLDFAVDADGYLYAVSGYPRNSGGSPAPFHGVYVFAPDGERVATWPSPSGYKPQAISIDRQGVAAIVAAIENGPVVEREVIVRIDRREAETVQDIAVAWRNNLTDLPMDIAPDGIETGDSDGFYLVELGQMPGQTDRRVTRVLAIDDDGGIVEEWEIPEHHGEYLGRGGGLAIGPDGRLWLADGLEHRLMQIDDGEVVIELSLLEPGQLARPGAIATGADGRVYSGDDALQSVTVFDAAGQPLGSWYAGTRFPDPTQQRGVALAQDGTVVVSYGLPGQIMCYSQDGELLDEWTQPMGFDDSNRPDIFRPLQLAIGEDDVLYVVMRDEPTPWMYSLDGELLGQWPVIHERGAVYDITVQGTTPYALISTGQGAQAGGTIEVQRLVDGEAETVASFELPAQSADRPEVFPMALAVDASGAIYLADPLNVQILKLDSEGNEIARWPVERPSNNFGTSLSLAILPDGRLLVADAESQQILVYAPPS